MLRFLIQIISGVALLNAAKALNNEGYVNWFTFSIALIGFSSIIFAILDYYSTKK